MRTKTPQRDKKPLVHVGPGLTISLVIIAALLAMRFLTPGEPGNQPPSAGPVIEKPIVSTTQDSLGPVPSIRLILDHADVLRLSAQQTSRLGSLQADWQRLYGPKVKEAEALGTSLEMYLGEKKGSRKAPVAQIEGKATPFVSISREIATGRRQYWGRAMRLLTPKQRSAVQTIRMSEHAKQREALARAVAKRSGESR